ncbi:hypothetical protein Tco_0857259 [Tanacetum coccineum]|uniref:Phospholipase-like protein n=1 Tax=Tanacetum coccineum TaxID=301880 RepID=A0ABQ5B7U5_9ASTR
MKGVNSCFRERVFPENSSVKGLDLNKLLNNHTEFNKLLDDDVVRVCLLLALDFVFMGFKLRHVIANELLGLVDDLLAWNDFPWEVNREVDVRSNVHHDVEEGLSVPEILKKISDMQRDFQSRITAVEQFVNHHKTSNVAAECMSVDKNPSCGSDVKTGNKESMCIDSSVKTSCITDINANNVHNDSMDFDHDLKQSEFDQNMADKNLILDFDQTVKWKILLNDEVLEEPQLSCSNFIVEEHQQVSSKNCKVPLAGAKNIVVDALIKIINFYIPKELPIQPMVIETPIEGCKSGETSKSMISETQSHTFDSVEEANDAKAKASKYYVSPYMIQPKSTQQNHKVCARNKKVKKKGLPLTAHDGKVIPEWKEAKKGVGVCLIQPAEADWAIHDPFFNTFMLGDKIPCCYVDGVTYGVPWFSESVKKVYFSINVEDNH